VADARLAELPADPVALLPAALLPAALLAELADDWLSTVLVAVAALVCRAW
jgi:hypothetical protein